MPYPTAIALDSEQFLSYDSLVAILIWAYAQTMEEIIVAAVCEVCGKGPRFGKSVSHSHVRTNRRWNPNIQRVRALVDGTPKRLNVCTSCLKAGKVTRNI